MSELMKGGIAVAIAMLPVLWSQHATRKHEIEMLRNQARLALFKEIDILIQSSHRSIAKFSSAISPIRHLCRHIVDSGPIQHWYDGHILSAMEITNLWNNLAEDHFALCSHLDKNKIIIPPVSKYSQFLLSEWQMASEIYYQKLSGAILRMAPLSLEGKKVSQGQPQPALAEYIATLLEPLEGSLANLKMYYGDLMVYCQNELLGTLFQRKVQFRNAPVARFAAIEPNDKSIKKTFNLK